MHTHKHTHTHTINNARKTPLVLLEKGDTHKTHIHTHTYTYRQSQRHIHTHTHTHTSSNSRKSDFVYGEATISRLLKIIGLFCRISSLL